MIGCGGLRERGIKNPARNNIFRIPLTKVDKRMKTNEIVPVLELKNITVVKGNENLKVLDHVSLKIYPGENTAILGPNGAGKTTLLKIITRECYPRPDKTSVCRVWGRDRWNIFELRCLLGLVSNDLQTLCSREVSGFETVLSGFFGSIGLHRERVTARMRQKALKILRFLEIEHLKNRKLSVMSSGEARRFLIGRALVHHPRALILDEPTNSLDLRSAHHFKALIRKIAGAGISIVLVTQNLQDIVPEIKRVILMKSGRIIKDGIKNKIITQKNIRTLFDVPVRIVKKQGCYHTLE